jgi:predicted NBD/HSP70 family sugar kinase
MNQQSATPRLLRRLNATRVLDTLRAGGPRRVTELVAQTGLSRPTVDAVADDLVRLGWVREVMAETPRRGRPARSLAFKADAGHVAAVDIGEVKVRTAVADLSGEILAERVREFDGADRLPVIRRAAAATLKAAGITRGELLTSCVGCTGAVDPVAGRILFSTVLPDGFDLRSAMQRTLAPPVLIENDCNLAVIGERWRGVAAGVDDVICVLGGERIGAGIVVGGKLMRGHAGAAGELAFLGAYAQEHGARGIAQLVRTLAGDAPEAVFEAARSGDRAALDVVERSARWAGLAIVTMAQVLNPELVVIGGGVAGAGDVLLDPLRRLVDDTVSLAPRIEASALGARGVLIGAIRHALDDLEPRLLDGLEEAA